MSISSAGATSLVTVRNQIDHLCSAMPIRLCHKTPIKGGWSRVEMAINNLKARVSKAVVVAVLISLLIPTNSNAAGRANDVVNTIRSGSGVPSASLGNDGDFYIDLKSMNFYGPKKNKLWPLPISLRGPVGATGPSGVDGKMARPRVQLLVRQDLLVLKVIPEQQVQREQQVRLDLLVQLVQTMEPPDLKVTLVQRVQLVLLDLREILELLGLQVRTSVT